MRGSNGLHPVANLSDRTKCPEHPTKRKWCDGDLAKDEAERRTRSLGKKGITIAAYLCPACGCYHLTKSTGGDSITLPDGKFTVGEFQALAPNHPVFATPEDPEPPIVPGDHETRVKFARRYLATQPEGHEPTTVEMCEAIGGCTKESLRKVMQELGYRNTRGRSARWVRVMVGVSTPDEATGFEVFHEEPAPLPEVDDRIPLDLSYDNDSPEFHCSICLSSNHDDLGHQEPGQQIVITLPADLPAPDQRTWIDLNVDRIRHMALGDLLDAYAASGLEIRVQVEVP